MRNESPLQYCQGTTAVDLITTEERHPQCAFYNPGSPASIQRASRHGHTPLLKARHKGTTNVNHSCTDSPRTREIDIYSTSAQYEMQCYEMTIKEDEITSIKFHQAFV